MAIGGVVDGRDVQRVVPAGGGVDGHGGRPVPAGLRHLDPAAAGDRRGVDGDGLDAGSHVAGRDCERHLLAGVGPGLAGRIGGGGPGDRRRGGVESHADGLGGVGVPGPVDRRDREVVGAGRGAQVRRHRSRPVAGTARRERERPGGVDGRRVHGDVVEAGVGVARGDVDHDPLAVTHPGLPRGIGRRPGRDRWFRVVDPDRHRLRVVDREPRRVGGHVQVVGAVGRSVEDDVGGPVVAAGVRERDLPGGVDGTRVDGDVLDVAVRDGRGHVQGGALSRPPPRGPAAVGRRVRDHVGRRGVDGERDRAGGERSPVVALGEVVPRLVPPLAGDDEVAVGRDGHRVPVVHVGTVVDVRPRHGAVRGVQFHGDRLPLALEALPDDVEPVRRPERDPVGLVLVAPFEPGRPLLRTGCVVREGQVLCAAPLVTLPGHVDVAVGSHRDVLGAAIAVEPRPPSGPVPVVLHRQEDTVVPAHDGE